jgi:7-cyano-7-deazaguanine synthase
VIAVLFSGGLDSTTLVHLAAKRHGFGGVAGVAIDYGQPHAVEELGRARALAARRGLELLELRARFDPPIVRWRPPLDARAAVVPHRNALLVALAAHAVADRGVAELWIGACLEDRAAFADCRPAWLAATARALELAGGPPLVAPLVELPKTRVWDLARDLGRDALDDARASWSCYLPTAGEACGACGACDARGVAP